MSFVALSLLLNGSPAQAMPKAPEFVLDLPPYYLDSRDYTFPSGLRVLLQRDDSSPVVVVSTIVDGGTSSAPVDKPLTARLLEYNWFQSQVSENKRVQDELYALGAKYTASTGADYTEYVTLGPRDALPSLLKLESQRISDPLKGVSNDTLLVSKEVLKSRPSLVGGSPMNIARPYMYSMLYPEGHPYAHVTEALDGLGGYGLEDLKAYADARYRPENVTMTIAGDIDLDQTMSLLFWALEPEMFHADLKEEHFNKYFRHDIEGEPDEENPWHLVVYPNDPNDPDEYLNTDSELGLRIDRPIVEPPPPVAGRDDMPQVYAMVDQPVAIVGWSLPAGYRNSGIVESMTAKSVEGLMRKALKDDPMLAMHPVLGTDMLECNSFAGLHGSQLLCSMPLDERAIYESMAERGLDQVSTLWNPDFVLAVERMLYNTKNNLLTTLLHKLDNLSDPYTGRISEMSRHAHFSGSLTVQSDKMNGVMGASVEQIRDLGLQFLDRRRAVRMVLMPMPKDQRVDIVQKGLTYPGMVPDTGFRLDQDQEVTAESLKASYEGPDFSKIEERTLSNGLRVVVLPYGVAPTALVSLVWNRGKFSPERGMDDYADFFQRRLPHPYFDQGSTDVRAIAGRWNHYRTGTYSVEELKVSSGNMEEAIWSLRNLVHTRQAANDGKARWVKMQRSALEEDWFNEVWWSDQAQWAHMAPGAHLPWRMGWEEIETFKGYKPADAAAYHAEKYVPKNGTLVVVGKVEPEVVFASAERYFADWKQSGERQEAVVENGSSASGAKVVVLDVPGAPVVTLDMGCRLTDWEADTWSHGSLYAEMLGERLNETLRQPGKLVFAAFASAQPYDNGLLLLQMLSMVPAEDAGPSALKMLSLVNSESESVLDESRLSVHMLHFVRELSIRYQSLVDMRNALLDLVVDAKRDLGWYDTLGEQLSTITLADLEAAKGTCGENTILSIRGPLAEVEPSLKASGIEYEVIDWEGQAMTLLETHNPKAAKKRARQKK